MKRVVIFLLLFLFATSFSAAKIVVHDSDVKKTYNLYDIISGTINVSLEDVGVTSLITSNRGDEISIKDFLDKNTANYTCSAESCEQGFTKTGGTTTKNLQLNNRSEQVFIGFTLKGESVKVTGLSLEIKSDFNSGPEAPLSFDFFGKENWTYNNFSNEYSLRNYGCYDRTKGTPGPKLSSAKYCEVIRLSETAAILAGVEVSGTGGNLKMVIHDAKDDEELATCNYDPKIDSACILTLGSGEIFEAEEYHVCVEEKTITNYAVLSEKDGNNCGFAHDFGPGNSEQDFAIHARTAHYANASYFNETNLNFGTIESAANDYLEDTYENDCSETCILPIGIRGVAQNLDFSNILLSHSVKGIGKQEEKLYDLKPIPVTLDFNGVVDVKHTGFNVSKGGLYTLSLEGTKLLSTTFDELETPEILDLNPKIVPAGVPIEFSVVTGSASGSGLKYQWNFGGNSSSTITSEPVITRTLPNVQTYTVSVSVKSETSASPKKTFDITAISPKEAINQTIFTTRKQLNSIKNKTAKAPPWYRGELERITNITHFTSELDRLEKASKTLTNDTSLIGIAKTLYALNIPLDLKFDIEPNVELLATPADIDPLPVAKKDFGDTTNAAKYAEAIAHWQETNVIAKISMHEYKLLTKGQSEGKTLRAYTASIHSYLGEEGYLVIGRPKETIIFNGGIEGIETGDTTLIKLQGGNPQIIEFYVTGTEETTFFTSPVLTNVLLETDVNINCNNNKVCEEQLGENPKTCRNDCKPVLGASIYLILVIILALAAYTALQVWYKRHYETYLFENRSHLYNLLMFIANARARETEEKTIVEQLGSAGWSHEHIVYAMKKSRGERTGMLEIIPIEKIASYLRNRAARKAVQTQNTQIPLPQSPRTQIPPRQMQRRQGNQGNINKQGGFRRTRGQP